ncbi:hypothetical protein ACEWGI_11275 [Vibrio diabolicus]
MKRFFTSFEAEFKYKNQQMVHEAQSPFSWFTSSRFLGICLVGHIGHI